MTAIGWLQIALIFALVLVCVKPLGLFMARLFSDERTFLTPVLGPVERGFYRLAGVDPEKEQRWLAYTLAMLVFNAAGFVVLYGLMRFQAVLPLNPQGFDAGRADLAFNTAVSFVTNTNWQSYGGETTMSHLVQMAGFTVQNFLSAATGIALAIAWCGLSRASGAATVGNFWVDMTRVTLYVLLPLSILLALAFVLGHAADAAGLRRCDHARRRQADDRPRAGRLAGGHQAARHQRRRLLQCQRRAPVRESERRSATCCRSGRCC